MIRYIVIFIYSLVMCFFCTGSFAQDEKNIEKVVRYHCSGQYYRDIATVMKHATYYLRFRIIQNARSTHPRKMVIVMDIDDTALSNYPAFRTAGFPEMASDRRQIAGQGHALAIPFTLAFYNFAKAHHVHVIFVSLRTQALRVMTENNLQKVGFSAWDALLLRPNDFSDQNSTRYYQSRRADLRASGYDIIMNIGHRDRSLLGGGSDIDFKLPDPYLQLFL